MEFDRFICATQLLNTSKDGVLLKKIFSDSNLPNAAGSEPGSESAITLVRAEFLESLMHLASARCDREATLGLPRRTVSEGFVDMLEGYNDSFPC